jgi:hypothetical protein
MSGTLWPQAECSVRANNAVRANVFAETGKELENATIADVAKVRRLDWQLTYNCGKHTIAEIEVILQEHGLSFAGEAS